MKNTYIQITAIILLLTVNIINAQDVRYSQPFTNPLTLNPALMNINDDLRVILNHRSQWAGLNDGGYTTSSFTTLYPIFLNGRESKLDFGLNAIMDKAGAYKNMNISLSVGYGLKITTSSYLSVALSGGYFQKSLDASNLIFDDQYVLGSYDATNISGESGLKENVGYPDVNFGLLWSIIPDDSKLSAFIGASGFHMSQPNEAFTNERASLPRKYSFQTGIKMKGENKLDFSPNIIVNTQRGAQEIAAGLNMDYNLSEAAILSIGGWYRVHDAFVCILKVEFKNFALGYSYDILNSELGRTIGGLNTHEISLSYGLNRFKDESAASL